MDCVQLQSVVTTPYGLQDGKFNRTRRQYLRSSGAVVGGIGVATLASLNSTQTIAAVEPRSLDPEVIKRSYDHLLASASFAATTARVKYTITRDDLLEPGKFHEGLSQLVFEVAKSNGEEAVAIDTLPGHDAIMMAAVCPTVMLTVPSWAGLRHHPDKWTSQVDLGKGMVRLSAVLERMITAELPL